MKKLRLLTASGMLSLATLFLVAQPYTAAAAFNQTFLIDDALFTDTSSMSVSEIQSFLNSQGSLLANWRDDVDMVRPNGCVVHKATGKTAAQIIHEAATAWNAQIVENCSGTNVSYWGDSDYSNYTMPTVSPKVLLVTLQKEQSLISANGTYSKNPNDYKDPGCCSSNEYKLARAMGYGVPDSGSINEKYLGFYNQINWAAWQLRFNYERSGGNTSWDEVGHIYYSGPMTAGNHKRCASCSTESFDGYYPIDGKNIYMSNRATASLYYYTPHTYPGYYGNFNFVNFYEQWFGSVSEPTYRATTYYRCCHTNAQPGDSITFEMWFKNSGNIDWYDLTGVSDAPFGTKPVFLYASEPLGRTSEFGDGWTNVAARNFTAVYESDGTTLNSNQHLAEPGDIVKYEFDLYVPGNLDGGFYREKFQPSLYQNPIAFNNPNAFLDITVPKPVYSGEIVNKYRHKFVKQGQQFDGYMTFKNTGNVNWYDSFSDDTAPEHTPIMRLATDFPLFKKSEFGGDKWTHTADYIWDAVYESDGVTLASNQNVVKPGQIGRMSISFITPSNMPRGDYHEYFSLVGRVKVNGRWENYPVSGTRTFLKMHVRDAEYSAKLIQKYRHADLGRGDTQSSYIKYQNTGNIPWYDQTSIDSSPYPEAPFFRLVTDYSLLQWSRFGIPWGYKKNMPGLEFSKVYESDGVTLSADQHVVYPGQIVQFDFDLYVPYSTEDGFYQQWFVMYGSKKYDGKLIDYPIKGTRTFLNIRVD